MSTTITRIELQDQLTAELARRLGETEMTAIRHLTRLVEVLPPMTLIDLLKETERIEAAGGMRVKDGSRRRTKGGVFFKLCQEHVRATCSKRAFRRCFPWRELDPVGNDKARALRGGSGLVVSSTGACTGVTEQHTAMIHAPPPIVNIDNLQSKERVPCLIPEPS